MISPGIVKRVLNRTNSDAPCRGFLYEFVLHWHDWFGLPDQDRSSVPNGQWHVEATRSGATAFEVDQVDLRLMDVPVTLKMRTGRWSQTVWQVDDSPRYGGWGQFEVQGGIRRWRSNWTWRPLARRDAAEAPATRRLPGGRASGRDRHGPGTGCQKAGTR